MPLVRSDESDGTVPMLGVVPGDEGCGPAAGMLERGESLRRVFRSILESSEQGLGVRIVVADVGPAEGRNHTECLECGQHGGTFHGTAVVRVKHDAIGIEIQASTGLPEQRGGQLHRFLFVNLPPDDLSTPDVLEHI